MIIQKLVWDSDFFGLRIGRANLQNNEEAIDLAAMKSELAKEYDMLYVFDSGHVGFDTEGAKLVDTKVTYRKSCECKIMCADVTMYHGLVPSNDLYHLAQVSGGFSRFKLDKGFKKGSFEKMYNRWIENACSKDGSNKQIFVYNQSGKTKGMVTVDFNLDGIAHIGLVSVDPACQHTGIGSKMLRTLDGYLFRLGDIKAIEVPTQMANRNACHLYEKNGFHIESVIDIYHWWF